MYQQIRHLPIAEQIEYLTRQLVQIESINGTRGEIALATTVKNWLVSFPYFKKHPTQVWEQTVPNDSLGRKNVYAFLRGVHHSDKTVIYHAHMDTVGIDDFGNIKGDALDPDKLEQFFKSYSSDTDVQQDAISGDYLFGRGSLDMQSGLAVNLANLLYFSEHLHELPGNILFMINPDEESQHCGIISAISMLNHLKSKENLDYIAAINTDFITPLFENDTHRYIYTGTAGKLLPCFYIHGRATHVGDTLSGIDPTLVSSELNLRINNNLELTEHIEGELILPPSCLYQKDTKTAYNVQTAQTSYLYFNYFIYKSTAKEVMQKLEQIAKEVCSHLEVKATSQYETFAKLNNLPNEKKSNWQLEVITLGDFIQYLEEKGLDTKSVTKHILDTHRYLDERMLYFKIVEELQQLDPEKKPRVIIFYAPPYLPHNFLTTTNQKDKWLLQAIHEATEHTSEQTNEAFSIKKFFPYLSDGSFLSLHETEEEIAALMDNFPAMKTLYPVPFQTIRALNIASINMGVYGKDGHKWTERVYKPYSFGVLPSLIRDTTVRMLTVPYSICTEQSPR